MTSNDRGDGASMAQEIRRRFATVSPDFMRLGMEDSTLQHFFVALGKRDSDVGEYADRIYRLSSQFLRDTTVLGSSEEVFARVVDFVGFLHGLVSAETRESVERQWLEKARKLEERAAELRRGVSLLRGRNYRSRSLLEEETKEDRDNDGGISSLRLLSAGSKRRGASSSSRKKRAKGSSSSSRLQRSVELSEDEEETTKKAKEKYFEGEDEEDEKETTKKANQKYFVAEDEEDEKETTQKAKQKYFVAEDEEDEKSPERQVFPSVPRRSRALGLPPPPSLVRGAPSSNGRRRVSNTARVSRVLSTSSSSSSSELSVERVGAFSPDSASISADPGPLRVRRAALPTNRFEPEPTSSSWQTHYSQDQIRVLNQVRRDFGHVYPDGSQSRRSKAVVTEVHRDGRLEAILLNDIAIPFVQRQAIGHSDFYKKSPAYEIVHPWNYTKTSSSSSGPASYRLQCTIRLKKAESSEQALIAAAKKKLFHRLRYSTLRGACPIVDDDAHGIVSMRADGQKVTVVIDTSTARYYDLETP